MNDKFIDKTRDFNEKAYKILGIKAQRRYPNEEFCRFMGRNFLDKDIDPATRSKIRILETGCGSGANLWMIAKEGFDAYGIDLSKEGLNLAEKMLDSYGVKAHLSEQNMCDLNFSDNYFDAIADIFSSLCLTKSQGKDYLKSVHRLLKPNGLFFSYFPEKNSEAYQFPKDASFIDSDTLNSIKRKDSPFYGGTHPFRFMHPREYESLLRICGFEIQYLELIQKTYGNQKEKFSWIIVEAKKK